ncbi:MAG: hypothetical protein HZC54_14095 [Verrucomicrobia bacterium]|nr:hypothetical protein [Verrucomicrobiota bacterium]
MRNQLWKRCGGVFAALSVVVCVALAAAQDINPYPRQLLRTESLHQWDFKAGTAGWTALHHCAVGAVDGVLKIQSSGNDPYLISGPICIEAPLAVRLRVKCATEGSGEFFWTTTESPQTTPDLSQRFKLVHDGQWHDYTVRLDARGTVTRLRFDPGVVPGVVEVEKIELVREVLHPLEIMAVRAAGRQVSLSLTNHTDKAIACAVDGRQVTLGGNSAQTLTISAGGKAPFETRDIAVLAEGLPALRRTVFIADAEAAGDWIERKSGNVALKVARDGSGARVEVGGKLVGFVAPLVWRDDVAPKLKLAGQGGTLKFAGDGVSVAVGLRGDEISVVVQSDGLCEGPVLRAMGALEQGVFAGLEYLGKGERSSSKLDIETEEHIRFAPDPLKVTMPLMAFVTDRVSAAMTWRDMSLQPVFATPNFLDGAEGHRAALRGKKIEATILVRKPAPMEDVILWAVKKRGLPALPKAPRSREAQMALSLKALTGPPLRTDAGWGHCAEPHWQRHPFADCASTIWRLTGEAPRLPKLVMNGSHIRNEAIYFVTGRAKEWLTLKTSQIRGILAAQKADGSFRYTGKYQRGHFEDTASGYCAASAVLLLEHARATGDKAALEAGVKTLEFTKRFRTPRGAQTWECALHTPDILGSAHLVHAYVRGYELTGNREYLDQARRWAITGLPFVYQWSCQPVMIYATTPVLGATNWRAPNWIGLPVQWCGYDYAYALTMLVPYDKTLNWRQLAEGILIAAEQMQYPDGEFAGCVPDSFSLAEQRRNPWNINPCAIVSLRLVLEGKLDALSVAVADGRRVVAPFPVTIRGSKAHIRAKEGIAYQMLVDGQRVVDVRSQGEDIVSLD